MNIVNSNGQVAIYLDFIDRLKLGDLTLSLLRLSVPLAPPARS